MPTASVRRTILVLLCALMLAAAVPASAAGTERETVSVQSAVTAWAQRLWSFLSRSEGKAGCMIDPFGRCAPLSQETQRKAGCRLDPFGRCLP